VLKDKNEDSKIKNTKISQPRQRKLRQSRPKAYVTLVVQGVNCIPLVWFAVCWDVIPTQGRKLFTISCLSLKACMPNYETSL
jgi:hypothetical protein